MREALYAVLDADEEAVTAAVRESWPGWDPSGTGIRRDKAAHVLAYVRTYLPEERIGSARRRHDEEASGPPLAAGGQETWFRWWDVAGTGVLHRDEVARALLRTWLHKQDGGGHRELARMRCLLEGVWPAFDPEGTGTITRGAFCRREGLGEALIAEVIVPRQQAARAEAARHDAAYAAKLHRREQRGASRSGYSAAAEPGLGLTEQLCAMGFDADAAAAALVAAEGDVSKAVTLLAQQT